MYTGLGGPRYHMPPRAGGLSDCLYISLRGDSQHSISLAWTTPDKSIISYHDLFVFDGRKPSDELYEQYDHDKFGQYTNPPYPTTEKPSQRTEPSDAIQRTALHTHGRIHLKKLQNYSKILNKYQDDDRNGGGGGGPQGRDNTSEKTNKIKKNK